MAKKYDVEDPKQRERLLNLIRAGNHPHIAAQSLGISQATWYRWRNHALAGRKKFARFFEEVEQAQAECEARDVITHHKASSPDKVPIECPECGHEWQEDPDLVLALTGFTETSMRIKAMAAANAMQRLQLRFPKRWSPRITHAVEDQLNEFLDVAERVLEGKVFRLLLQAYVAEGSGEAEVASGGGEPPAGAVH